MAFIAFILIGLTISISIRACTHHKSTIIEEKTFDAPESSDIAIEEKEDYEIGEPQVVPVQYSMSDSVIRICMPKPHDGISEMILRKSTYIVSYNKDTKLPNWVAWNLTSEHTDGPYRRLGNFYEDEGVPQPRATNDDYRGSGWSRGHMCPAGDNKWNEKAMFDTFSLVNVCPQNANLNSGLWNSIEIDCRRWARKFGDIFIVCGPLYMNREHEIIGNNQIVVPEAFFKVVLCLKGNPKGIGFIVRNSDGTKKRDLYYNSINQVERITGMDFFPALPDDTEEKVESIADINDWN
jgi:endonuclease G